MSNVLEINNLNVHYVTPAGLVRAVDDVSFTIKRGEIFGLAGESGCGKSTTAFGIARLLRPPAQLVSGSIKLNGRELTTLTDPEFDKIRWSQISVILQSAMNNLNPVMRIRDQLADAIEAHEDVSADEIRRRVDALADLVSIPRSRLDGYPHQLSGGMRQRIVFAMSLALKPSLVIMDEPTTALDVVVQGSILSKVLELQQQMQFSVLFISHDLPLMLELCDRVGVMYAGKIVENASRTRMLEAPQHPYTQGLLEAFPSFSAEKRRLTGIPGSPVDLRDPPSGCRFHPRCRHRLPACTSVDPPFISTDHDSVACHLFTEEVMTHEHPAGS